MIKGIKKIWDYIISITIFKETPINRIKSRFFRQ